MTYISKKAQIAERQAQINAHGELSKELKRKINYKFRLDWNYYSNSIEGNTLTMPETRSVMLGNITVHGKSIKDILEIKGHDSIISKILEVGKGDVRLSESRIKEIHRGIMHEENPTEVAKIGVWKTEYNCIYNYKGEKFEFVPPYEVADKVHELLNKTNAAIDAIKGNKKNAPHPIDVALQFHLEYVFIHPFYDGNGRTARILTNLLLISFGYPPFWVKNVELDNYHQYIGEIQGYDAPTDLFMDFAAGLILRSQQLMLDAIEGKEINEPSDLDKELTLLTKELEGKNQLEIAATPELIFDMMEFNLVPIFALLETKCQILKEYFFDFDKKINILFQENIQHQLVEKDSSWQDVIQHFIDQNKKEQDKKIYSINYEYSLIGFKKTIEAKSFYTGIEVYFGAYNYTIRGKYSNTKELLLPYGKILKEEELYNIVTPLIKNMIENIKKTAI